MLRGTVFMDVSMVPHVQAHFTISYQQRSKAGGGRHILRLWGDAPRSPRFMETSTNDCHVFTARI